MQTPKVRLVMTKSNALVADRRLAAELSGSDKIAALLRARGWTLASYARSRGWWPEQVKMALSGARPYPEIREALAQDLDLPRAEIDRLIDGDADRSRIPA